MRVATLNLFNNRFGRWEHREPLVIEQARALDADAYAFQEVAARSSQVDRLLDGLGPGYVAVRLENPDPASIKSLAVVTRLAVAGHDACVELDAGDIALRVFLETGDGVGVSFVTTHFHWSPTRQGSECRRRQAEQLLAWLGGGDERDGRVVLVGDFNAVPGGATVALLKQRFRSAFEVAHGSEPEWTHPTPLYRAVDAEKAFGVPVLDPHGVAIDYVFVGAGIGVERCELAWDRPSAGEPYLYPSDHLGLVADLRV